MMNRILKRPMFRMGGRSDDGIMSVRPGYQNGGPLTTPDLFLQAQKVPQKPFLTLEEITLLLIGPVTRFNLLSNAKSDAILMQSIT